MAFKYENRIDALGGVESASGKSADWVDGYNAAAIEASEIGADADDMIAELMDLLGEIVFPDGRRTLKSLIDDAEILLRRIEARCA
jgi:hypothetical protein